MVDKQKERRPQTLKEYNNSRLMSIDIMTGKEFRRQRRKRNSF